MINKPKEDTETKEDKGNFQRAQGNYNQQGHSEQLSTIPTQRLTKHITYIAME